MVRYQSQEEFQTSPMRAVSSITDFDDLKAWAVSQVTNTPPPSLEAQAAE